MWIYILHLRHAFSLFGLVSHLAVTFFPMRRKMYRLHHSSLINNGGKHISSQRLPVL